MSGEGTSKCRTCDTVGLLARWLVGVLFVYMGISKALHPVDFLKLVHQYEFVTSPLALNIIAGFLPWFEVFCGLLLLAGVAVRGTALVTLAMLVPFTLLVLKRALAIAAAQHVSFTEVKFDCGCGNGEIFIWKKMIENTLLILLACFLVSGRARKGCLRFSLLGSGGAEANGSHEPCFVCAKLESKTNA